MPDRIDPVMAGAGHGQARARGEGYGRVLGYGIGRGLASLAAGGFMLAILPGHLREALPDPHALSRPVTVAAAMPKRNRLPARKQPRLRPAIGSVTPGLDLLEARMDGSFTSSSYFTASIDFSQTDADDAAAGQASTPKAPLASNSAAPAATATNPFALVMAGEQPGKSAPTALQTAFAASAPGPAPVNFSVAAAGPAPAVHRLVAMPQQRHRLDQIEGGCDIADDDWSAIGRYLGKDSLEPGERLELLYGDPPAGGGKARVLMVRYSNDRGDDQQLARQDDGDFSAIDNHALYSRLVAEAMARQEKPEADSTPTDVAQAYARAEIEVPALMDRLQRAQVPAAVALQVLDLLKRNKVDLTDGSPALSKLRMVFRRLDGKVELVFLAMDDRGTEKRFYRFSETAGHDGEFLDENGRSVAKPLIGNPVPGSKRNDGFGWRMHPILHTPEFHNGVDFDAPRGTPIVAAGDGVVVKIDFERGYGKYVRVQHDQGYTTTYAHIDGTAKGLKVGARVAQGQVIAFVGSTGLSTGPHLYYELRMGDKYADPTSTRMPAGTALHGNALSAFHQEAERVDTIARFVVTSAKSAASNLGHDIAKAVAPKSAPGIETGP